jgi:hypothetical protein
LKFLAIPKTTRSIGSIFEFANGGVYALRGDGGNQKGNGGCMVNLLLLIVMRFLHWTTNLSYLSIAILRKIGYRFLLLFPWIECWKDLGTII